MNAPYLDYIISNTDLNGWQHREYLSGEFCVIDSNLYKSLINDNSDYPLGSPLWKKIL